MTDAALSPFEAAWRDVEVRDGVVVAKVRDLALYRLDDGQHANVLVFQGLDAVGSVVEVYATATGLLVEANNCQVWPPEDAA